MINKVIIDKVIIIIIMDLHRSFLFRLDYCIKP